MQTDQQIIDQTNQLALKFYRLKHPHTAEGTKFHEAEDKKAHKAWLLACIAQEFLCGVNVEEAWERLSKQTTEENSK